MHALVHRAEFTPRVCVWEITRGCQLQCAYCGSLAGHKRANELDTREALALVDDLADLGCRVLTLSGGEPTLRRDWTEIATHARERGLAVNMVTNGQADPVRLADDAVRSGLVNVGVSIDGMQPTHDALRGAGTHARAIATVRALVARGVFVEVMYTVHRRNLAELEALHALAVEVGARALRTQLAKPMGRLTGHDGFALRGEDMLSLLPRIGALANAGPLAMHLGDSVGYYSPAERTLRVSDRGMYQPWTGCYAGVQAIGIQSDGSIKGCLSLQPHEGEADSFIEGNIRETPLRDLWFRPGAFAFNRQPDHHALGGTCARCDHGAVCRGGASCVSYAVTGALGRDPICYLAAHRESASYVEQSRLRRSARTLAAAVIALGAPACGGTVVPADGADVTADGTDAVTVDATDAQTPVDARDAGPDAIDCTNVCCACDYGLPPPPQCCP